MTTTPSEPTATTTGTCAARTASGARCRRKPMAGKQFCAQHEAAAVAATAGAGSGAARRKPPIAKGAPGAKGASGASGAKASGGTAGAAARKPPLASRAKAGGSSAAAASRSRRPVRDAELPSDIDAGALDEVLGDLRRSGRPAGGGEGGSTGRDDATGGSGSGSGSGGGGWGFGALGNLLEVVSAFAGSASKARDVALASGLVEASRVEQFVGDVARAMASLVAAFSQRAAGEWEEDDFGFDERFTEGLLPLAGLLYDYWWRVDVEGIEHVPTTGRALLVSNHAGAGLPFDGAMIKVALQREMADPRHGRMLVLDWLMSLPWLADFASRTGQVLACTPNAVELLERDEVVGVFPEGIKGMMKPFSQRYSLERFGRGGFVRIALRTGAPIVPVAVVGSEEIYPKIANIPFVNKLIGAPFVPMTPTFPLLGLAGLVPLPSKWHIEFCEPIDVASYGPEAADDRQFVLELSEQIRATIQARLRENLLKRTTPFW